MTTVDIFIRTYINDFELLKKSLISIKENVSGFNKLILCVKQKDFKALNSFLLTNKLNEKYIKVCYDVNYDNIYIRNASDYCGQQITKLKADLYSNADYIFFSDSDVIYFEKTDIKKDFFVDGLMLYEYRKWELGASYNIWKRCLQYLDILTDYEFMTHVPLIYPRSIITRTREYIESRTKKNFIDECYYIYANYDFSEFNMLGSFMYLNNYCKTKFVDSSEYDNYRKKTSRQFWSYEDKNVLNLQIQNCLAIKSNYDFKLLLSSEELNQLHYKYYKLDELRNEKPLVDVDITKLCVDKTMIDGFVFYTHKFDTCISDTIKTGVLFDKFVLSFVKQFIDPNKNIIDIGANIGTHSVIYSQYTKGEIYSFEPQPVLFEILNVNIVCNNCTNVFRYNQGASDKSGVAYIETCYTEKHNQGAFNFTNDNKCTQIKLITIDEYNFDNIGYVKIDVTGNEYEVLKGMLNTLRKYKPILLIEIQDTCKTRYYTLKLLYELGYKNFYKLTHADYVFINTL